MQKLQCGEGLERQPLVYELGQATAARPTSNEYRVSRRLPTVNLSSAAHVCAREHCKAGTPLRFRRANDFSIRSRRVEYHLIVPPELLEKRSCDGQIHRPAREGGNRFNDFSYTTYAIDRVKPLLL